MDLRPKPRQVYPRGLHSVKVEPFSESMKKHRRYIIQRYILDELKLDELRAEVEGKFQMKTT